MFFLSLFVASVSLLAAFSAFSPVEATPVKRDRSVTLPLTRVGGNNGSVHSLIYHQQLANHAARRAAYLLGGQAPSAEAQEAKMRDVIEIIDRLDRLGKRDQELAEEYPILLGMVPVHSLRDSFREDSVVEYGSASGPVNGVRRHEPRSPQNPGIRKYAPSTAPLVRDSHFFEAANPQRPQSVRIGGQSAPPPSSANSPASGPIRQPMKIGGQSAPPPSSANSPASGSMPTTSDAAFPPTSSDSAALNIEAIDISYRAKVMLNDVSSNLVVDTASTLVWTENPPQDFTPFTTPSLDTASYLDETVIQVQLASANFAVGQFSVPGLIFGISPQRLAGPGLGPSSDGVLGLAPPVANLKHSVLLQDMQRIGRPAVIGYNLGTSKSSGSPPKVREGLITLGGIDGSQITGSPFTLQNIGRKFWEVPISQVLVDGMPVSAPSARRRQFRGIIDTGSTFVNAPFQMAMDINSLISMNTYYFSGTGQFYIPCTHSKTVTLQLGSDIRLDIPSLALAHEPIVENIPDGYCVSGIQGFDFNLEANQWILGDVLLKNVYFWTDLDNDEIGFANLKSVGTVVREVPV
ncbi:hypothetical protein ONZ45_g2980 [Pleurotus djamor]|nr:hypothetical protein ONZ45_g2980 [Pleurotus djamor]